MKDSPRRHLAAIGLLAVLVAIPFALPEQFGTAPRSWAVPHVIHTNKHPFDDNWLIIKTVFAAKCVACHRPNCERCDLSTYEAVISAKSEDGTPLLVPGHPEKSMLWDYVVWNVDAQLDSPHPNSPMMPPDDIDWFTAGQLSIFKEWILSGALEYKLPQTCNVSPLLESDFPSAKECRTCHPKQYREWSQSMHAYAQHSPVFEAFNLTLVERTSGTIGTFCTRCHTPLGTALGENGSRRNVHRSKLSMEGVTCVVCHRQKRPYYKANSRQAIQPGGLLDVCMYGPFEDAVKLPGVHDAEKGLNIRDSSFCGSCHDVTNPQGVRLEEAYSEFQNSPAAKEGIRCHDCHMGPVQGKPIPESHRPWGRVAEVPGVPPEQIPLRPLSNHTFAGPDYSLLPDTEFPEKLDWMYEVDYRDWESLTPYQQRTLRDLRIHNRKLLEEATAKRYEVLRNSARIHVTAPATASPGEKVHLRVDVKSIFAGHNLPTGFTAERQVWVSVTVRDPLGRVIFAAGNFDENGDLRDEHSFEVEAGELAADHHLLNFQSKFIALTFRGTERPVVISVNRDLTPLSILRPAVGPSLLFGRPTTFRVAKSSLPPLSEAGMTYPVHIGQSGGSYTWCASLNFRHLPPALLDQIGTPHLKHLLEVVVIDSRSGVIQVGGAGGMHHQAQRPEAAAREVKVDPARLFRLGGSSQNSGSTR